MDIQELNKTQLILLTLLITFVVSVATGIVTVSLMQQVPKSVPATINNVIERTIEKVNTVPTTSTNTANPSKTLAGIENSDGVVSIYPSDDSMQAGPIVPNQSPSAPQALGQGIIISDIGLILVDTSILTDKEVYKVTLNKTDFNATILKKFNNGFAILKIGPKAGTPAAPTVAPAQETPSSPKVDNQP